VTNTSIFKQDGTGALPLALTLYFARLKLRAAFYRESGLVLWRFSTFAEM
jgi:hypothetical protein